MNFIPELSYEDTAKLVLIVLLVLILVKLLYKKYGRYKMRNSAPPQMRMYMPYEQFASISSEETDAESKRDDQLKYDELSSEIDKFAHYESVEDCAKQVCNLKWNDNENVAAFLNRPLVSGECIVDQMDLANYQYTNNLIGGSK